MTPCPRLLGATKGFQQKHGRIGLQLRSELGHVEPECERPEHLGGCVIFSRDCRESLIFFFFSRISHLTTPSFCLVLKAEGSTGRAVGNQVVLLLKPMNVQGDCPCVGSRWPLVLESLGVSSSALLLGVPLLGLHLLLPVWSEALHKPKCSQPKERHCQSCSKVCCLQQMAC